MSVKQVFNTSAELDYPKVLPTLDLDFANSKTLDPRITFTRASGGSYVGADGLIKLAGVNEPRFDHDPVTGESLGFLVEEARTNLTNYSEQFDNVVWTKYDATVTTNATTAPDGTLTADQFIENTVNAVHGFLSGTPFATANSTFSIYIKPAGRTRVYLQNYGGPNEAYFNLTGSGSVISGPGVIQAVANGWYRCSVSSVTISFSAFGLYLVDTGVNLTYTGDGTSGVFIWGAQVELGTFPTSYIPTVASTRTRAADNASIGSSATWFNPSGFTVVSDCQGTLVSLTQNNTGSGFPYIFSFGQSGNRLVGVRSAGGFNGSWSVYSQPPGIFAYSTNANFNSVRKHKVAAAYNLLDYLAVADGIIGTSITPAADPTLFVNFYLGRGDDGGFWGGTIARLTYYPKRLTNQQLQTLTS